MAKKSVKKVNPKDTLKATIKDAIRSALAEQGEFLEGKDFGFTKDTLILRTAECDVQIKLITPKTGMLRYEVETEEE